jgi:hypothetical protein
MGGGSSVKSVSKPSGFAIMMYFGGSSKVTTEVKTVNTIVYDSTPKISLGVDYEPISTNCCIGSSIQSHGPPMVGNSSFFHSFAVFTVNFKKSYHYKTNNFLKNIRECG